MLLGTLVYGFINSCILALVALGFNLTFGISGVANFAYGAIYIFSGFLTWILLNSLGVPYLLAVIIAILCAASVGLLMYYLIIIRVKGLSLSEVMATFGLGLAIMELFRYFDFVGFKYTLPVFFDGSVAIGDVYIDYQRLIIALIAVGLTLCLYLFTHHTKIGLAFRAIAQDERTALTFGIDSDRIGALSMAFGAGLAAIAAIVILPLGTIAVEGGYEVLINALAVCIVGGLGSTVGILVASVLIGYAQTFTANYLEPHWMMLVSLIAIAVVLVVKPSGLFSHQKELEEIIVGLSLDKYIKFLGFKNNPYQYYYYCDLFVLSSRWEGLPNAVLENLYLKKPIVATKCFSYIHEIIKDGLNGILVNIEDTDNLAKAILSYKKIEPGYFNQVHSNNSIKNFFSTYLD